MNTEDRILFRILRKSAILAERNGVDLVRTLHCGPYTVDLFAAGNSQTVV